MATAKAERSEATRASLISVARAMFSERGYADTSIEEVVVAAGVTRGALYHHFKDKQDLFRAVFVELEQELVAKAMSVKTPDNDLWKIMCAGTNAFLDACLDPTIQRVVLLDAPSVLGWEEWRAIDAKFGLGLIRHVMEEAMRQGVIEKQSLDVLSHVVMGALNEAALAIARAADPKKAREDAGETIVRLLQGLRKP